jgi:hypothetical protein
MATFVDRTRAGQSAHVVVDALYGGRSDRAVGSAVAPGIVERDLAARRA